MVNDYLFYLNIAHRCDSCVLSASAPNLLSNGSDEGSEHIVSMRNMKTYPQSSSNIPSCLEL